MKYRLRDVPAMLRTAGGRRQVAGGIRFRLWPLLSRLARLHRRTVVRHTRVIAVTGTFGKSTTARSVATAIGAPVHPGMAYNAFSSVARAVSLARSFTSLATTANPLPASPARAASMVALRASRLVCCATLVMSLSTLPIS